MSENKYPIGGYAPGEIKYGQLWARHSELVDKDSVGKYRITFEGLKKAVDEALSMQPKPAGAVWVKGEYDRLYDLLKADVNCRIVCYVDYNTRSKNPDGSPYILRDICSIWGENMEFGSRGIGYGSVRFIPGDYKENFIELCKQMNVEWLDESGTASNNDAIEFAEWCAFNYQRDFEPLDSSLPINEREYRQFWVDNDQTEYTTTDLYKLWQQSKSK